MLHKNPASAVDLPLMVRKEMKAMTPAEASRFLEAVKGTRQYALFNFALTTLNGLTLISKEDWQRFGGRLSGSAKKAAGGPLLSLRLSGHAGRYLCPPQP
jgi:hypothetical protein